MIFFNGWDSFFRTLIITFLAYISMVILLRVSGKRTLSKMNAFDFIVTIALGSALASVATNKSVTLADGLVVFGVLIFMQFLLTWLSVRIKSVKKIITSKPSMLLYKGELIDENVKKERITIEEINNAVRQKGYSGISDIDIIILETTGDITIIKELKQPEEAVEGLIKRVTEEK
jgi:uncharacterized membrane protein YcaP (DUF421 family)